MTFIRYILVLCVLFATLCGCVRQPADSARVEVLHQGQLEQPESDANIHPAVYVNVRDNTNKLFGLRAQTESWLQRQGFTVVPNPSEAGYILQVVVLSAGIAAPESVRQMVAAGYDTPSQLSGRGSTALVADVLLVQRHVPSAQQPSRSKLKSISKRNAVASSQMRIGLLSHQEFKGDGVPPVFAETMGKELATHIHGTTGQDAPTQPTTTP
jgi:hypothetical protein